MIVKSMMMRGNMHCPSEREWSGWGIIVSRVCHCVCSNIGIGGGVVFRASDCVGGNRGIGCDSVVGREGDSHFVRSGGSGEEQVESLKGGEHQHRPEQAAEQDQGVQDRPVDSTCKDIS